MSLTVLPSNGAGGYNITDSLRFRGGQNLTRTITSAGNRRTYTYSFWIKRGNLGTSPYVFNQFLDGNTNTLCYFNASGSEAFNVFNRIGGTNYQVQTSAVFRDTSAWYHIVVATDTTQATASDRVKIWINGEQVTSFSVTGYPPQNSDTALNSASTFYIGSGYAPSQYFDGYMTEWNFVDGQALTASDFGEYNTDGVWSPKKYTGTYGTNGFYLPFNSEVVPSVSAGFGGTASNVLYDDTAYLISNTSTGSGFDLIEYDFGESINMIDYNIQDLKWTGGTSTFRIYTSDVGGSLSNYTERASLSVSSSFQNYTGNLGVSARYVKIRATNFGTNGQAHLNYFNVDVDTNNFSDNSGNTNNWTPNNINLVSDITSDVPTLTDEDTSNFCTWNPINVATNITTTNANLSFNATTTSGNHRMVRATHGMTSGKYYWEVNVNNSSNVDIVGISSMDWNGDPYNTYVGGHSASAGYGYGTSTGNWYGNGFTSDGTTPSAFPSSGIIGVAFDADNGKLYFHRNGTWINSADPSAGTGANFTATTTQSGYLPAISTYNNQGTWSANFGQFPFAYTPPTGYLKLNSYNLPDSSITDGSQYMNIKLWTGNGTNQDVDVGWNPDLVWHRNRTDASGGVVTDSIRGDDLHLQTTNANAEGAFANFEFITNGYNVSGNANLDNQSGKAFVGWNWRGSDSTPVTNTVGDISSTVSANPTAGFSVVTWTGNGGSNQSVGHGLSEQPDMVIVKKRNKSENWYVATTSSGYDTNFGYHLHLNTTGVVDGNNDPYYLNSIGSVTDKLLLSNGSSNNGGNENGIDYVAYCWHSVEGYSKIGNYIGNGSADGTFVYTGFTPSFVLMKDLTSANSWIIMDKLRTSEYNPQDGWIVAHSTSAEYNVGSSDSRIDLVSNGFKLRNANAGNNGSGRTYLYMAFAENPFKNSLAR